MKRIILIFCFLVINYLEAVPPYDTFVVATTMDDLISLDPAEIFELTGAEYAENTYDRLVDYNASAEDKIQPFLAKSWTISEDGKEYTFHLREDVKFASGNLMTAEDVVFSLHRLILLNKSPAYFFVQFGWSADNIKDMVYAKDESTVVTRTNAVYAPSLFLHCLASANASVVEKKVVMAHENEGDFGNAWLKTHYAGSGPFVLEHWIPNVGLFLKSHDSYFAGAAKLKKVILRSVPEESSQKMLLMKGDVDLVRNLGIDQVEGLENVSVEICPLSSIYFMSINQQHPCLKIPEVRQALKYLIDYKNLAASTHGKMSVHQSFIPKGYLGSSEEQPFSLNVEKAKSLLEEVGLEKGFSVNLDCSDAEIAQAIQATFALANIQVKILQGDSRQVLTKMRARKHDLGLSLWIPDFCDPHNTVLTFVYNPDNSEHSNERTLAWRNGWQAPHLNKMVFDAMREQDTNKRKEYYVQLQQHFHNEAPFINLFHKNRILVRRKESVSKGVRIMSPKDMLSYYVCKGTE